MPQSVVDALRDSGLFSIMVPRSLGGSEVSAVTALAVFEELTAADASIGWSHMANASTSAFSAYLGDDAVEAMFAGRPAIMAGQFSPKGPSVAVDGGYQVQGRYAFGSGSASRRLGRRRHGRDGRTGAADGRRKAHHPGVLRPAQRGRVPRRLGRDGPDRHRFVRLRHLRARRARRVHVRDHQSRCSTAAARSTGSACSA